MRTIYLNPSDDQFEWQMVSTLKTEIDDFPSGEIEKQESPDFIIRASDKTVGIEVTRAINPNLANPTPLTEIRGAQFKCREMARKMIANKRNAPVEVKVKFRDDHTRINIKEAAKELCDFVLENVNNIDDTKTWHYYESGLKHISWLSIHLDTAHGKKWLHEHRVDPIIMNWFNINPHETIQKAIDSKKAKIAGYHGQCDECWLIVGVNEITAPEAIMVLENDDSTYFSDFARTYFVQAVEGRVWSLKVIPYNKN
ncbi:MAG: hypothetical protein ACFFCW_43165 [Candidatus Hodarchaeota archaeon]